MISESTVKLALLIDADNAQPVVAGPLLAEVARLGTSFVRGAYGDWTGLKVWEKQPLARAIQPNQQFAYTQDLLYSNRFDGFCLVSGDGDFTRLASRIRESDLVVCGFGERHTPKPFVATCDKFIYVENLYHEPAVLQASASLSVAT